jgi:broad specificity phosphatase PhoE
MSTLYLVRHGQASFGTDDYDRLSATGREQIRLLGEYFAERGERIDRIYTGHLQRQRDAFDEYDSDTMLRQFADSLTPQQLEEAGWPALHNDRRRFQFFLERAARAWVEARIEAAQLLPWKQFQDRIVRGLDAVMRSEGRSKTLLVSTSGGVIGTAVAHVLGLANHLGIELNWAVHNASITRLMYNDGRVSLSMFNGLPHLDRPGRRELITYR